MNSKHLEQAERAYSKLPRVMAAMKEQQAMSKTYFDLLPHEAKAAAEKRLGMLIRPFDNPPPEDMSPTLFRGPEMYHPTVVDDDGEMDAGPAVFGIYDELGEWGCASPFIPDTVLHCRETGWMDKEPLDFPSHGMPPHRRFFFYDRTVIHEHDGSVGKSPFPITDAIVSVSGSQMKVDASEMPDWAIRFRPTVGEVRCKRVKELTLGHWVNAGWLTSIYEAKPITRTEELLQGKWDPIHGAGSWEANPWVWICNLTPTDQP